MTTLNRNILLIHVPKFINYYEPINKFSFIQYHPLGLLGLVDFASQHGLSSLILDLGVEKRKYGSIDLKNLFCQYDPDIVGIGLHWHFQSYDVIEVARQIKKLFPKIPIVLGGITASYFAEEIIRAFDFIDYVIRGDAEVPLVKLTQCVRVGKEPNEVPNLVYKKDGIVYSNARTYIADSHILNNINFTKFESIKDFPSYRESLTSWFSIDGISRRMQNLFFGSNPIYPVFLGRGCLNNCSYCGGGASAQLIINNRCGVSIPSPEKVAESIRNIEDAGFKGVMLNYDPLPAAQAEAFYMDLFELLQSRPTSLIFEIERWSLPSEEFIRKFKETVHKESYISISLNSHHEETRRKNNMYFFSNEELEKSLAVLDTHMVKSKLFFAMGLPYESKEDIAFLVNYQRRLRNLFKFMRMKTCIIEVEPCSDISRNPSTYNLELERRSFMDYYQYHSQPDKNQKEELGYFGCEVPNIDYLRKARCRYFCDVFNAGKISPILCKAVGLAWKSGLIHALDRVFFAKEEHCERVFL